MTSSQITSIQTLKKQAKICSKTMGISLHKAQDLIANQVGFTHWSLLMKSYSNYSLKNLKDIFLMLKPGHLIMISADKNVGKMSFSMNLVSEASKNYIKSSYYSFHEQADIILKRMELIFAHDKREIASCLVKINYFNDDYEESIRSLEMETAGSFIIIDYLQKISGENINSFILKLNKIAKNQKIRILALSQHVANCHELYRHFIHVLLLKNSEKNDKKRSCILVKSTHFQIQDNELSFDRSCYKFE